MSGRGLGNAIGVSSSSITRLIQKALRKPDTEWLKVLSDLDIYLGKALRNGQVKIISDEACAAIATYYAVEKGNLKAIKFLAAFAAVGLRAYIQKETGWTPQKEAVQNYLPALILEDPKDWSLHFGPEWRAEAERVTGYSWSDRCMSRFINRTIYGWFPDEVRAELDRVNPSVNGKRLSKQHQHFANEASEILKAQIDRTYQIMLACATLSQFEQALDQAMTRRYQLSLKIA